MGIQPKMKDIASAIQYYLDKHPDHYETTCYASGRFVKIRYRDYWSFNNLTKYEALHYLEWLQAGNVGSHWECA